MKIAIICQATGKCRSLAARLIPSLEKYFIPGAEKHYLIFSDRPYLPGGFKTRPMPELADPTTAFFRYEMFLAAEEEIKTGNYDMVFNIDADMEAVRETKWEDVALADDQDAVLMQHPTITTAVDIWLPLESKWRLGYYQACFYGCRPAVLLDMAKTLSEAVREEQNLSFPIRQMADEGYFNSYWLKRIEKVKVVPCSFGYPPDVNGWLQFSGSIKGNHYSEIKKEDARFIHHNVGTRAVPGPYSLFGKYPWSNKIPLWAMDERHIYWMYEVLASGHHKTALEVGPAFGATSSAFVEALNAGHLEHATFVDIKITDELKQTLGQCKYPERITLAETGSLEVLKRGEWDFILIDGDHSLETVSREVDELLRLRPLTVMAHDTNLDTENGPEYLKHVLQVLPEYYCLEDNMRREGERTERGMFLATRSEANYRDFKKSLAYWSSR